MVARWVPCARRPAAIVTATLVAGLVGVIAVSSGARASTVPPESGPPVVKKSVVLSRKHLDDARLDTTQKKPVYTVVLDEGSRAELTLDPRLQKLTEKVLAAHRRPYAAAVLMSVEDGRVLAIAGRSEREPKLGVGDLTLAPWAPAASVFKIVTASALVDEGVSPAAKICYHGGIHSVEASNLTPDARLDRDCATFSYGLAKSQNAIIARLAVDNLEPDQIYRHARALGFGERLPADLVVDTSQVTVPSDLLPFARVAAGFWQTTLSPFHGAWLAATIARGGMTPQAHVIQRIFDEQGDFQPVLPEARRAVDEETARTVGKMMVGCTKFGTARRAFHDSHDRYFLPGIAVAGKTGSLTRRGANYTAFSWFVGFAPANRPKVAVAVLIGNNAEWRLRASFVARELLEGYFRGGSRSLLAVR